MVESPTITSPGRAPRTCSASRSPTRAGTSIQSCQPETSSLAPLLDGGGEPVARGEREAAERVAVEVDAGRIVVDEAVAEAAQRVGCVERDRRRRGSAPATRPRPATAGSPGRGARSGPRPAASRGRSRRARAWNSSLIAGGTMSSLPPCVNSDGHAEREPRGGRGRRVALGLLLGRPAQQAPHDAVGEPPLPRALEVEHAGLRDDAGDLHARPRPRGGERGEVPARRVADRRRRA